MNFIYFIWIDDGYGISDETAEEEKEEEHNKSGSSAAEADC